MTFPLGTAGQVVGTNSGATALTNLSGFVQGSSGSNGIITGTNTNDSAAAGKVGEFAQVNSPTGGTATPGATDAFVNITSMSLTAGDWDVWGTARFDTGGTWIGTRYDIAVSLSTAAADSSSNGGYIRQAYTIPASTINLLSTGNRRILLSTTTTVYLVGSLTYTTLGATTWSTNSTLIARRVR